MILVLTIPVTITMALLFIIFFVMASKSEQFEDLETPQFAPLSDEAVDTEMKSNEVFFEE